MTALPAPDMPRLIERLRLYGQAQRLSILSSLTKGQRSVSEIETQTGITQPALSQQLGELRRAGVIVSTRSAREVTYTFSSEAECNRVLKVLALLDESATHPAPREAPRYGAHFAMILPQDDIDRSRRS